MGVFKELDPELAWKLIEGYEDELAEASNEQSKVYRGYSCPRCKCDLEKEFDSRVGWKADKVLPQFLLRCSNCGYTIDPSNNLVIVYGNAAKVPTPDKIPIVGQT